MESFQLILSAKGPCFLDTISRQDLGLLTGNMYSRTLLFEDYFTP